MNKKFKYITLPIVLLSFFIILSENLNIQVLLIGIIVSMIVSFFNREDNIFSTGRSFLSIRNLIYLLEYILLLIKEIIIANIQVAKIVLSRDIKISPSVFRFKTKLRNDLLKVILANSITLTPGTITMEIMGDEFIIHCLLKENMEGLINSKFERLLLKVEE